MWVSGMCSEPIRTPEAPGFSSHACDGHGLPSESFGLDGQLCFWTVRVPCWRTVASKHSVGVSIRRTL